MAVNLLRLAMCRGASVSRFQAQQFAFGKQQALLTSYTASRKLVPYNPQVTAVRKASEDSNYVWIWKAERILSASMVAIIPGAFLMPNTFMDCLLAASVTMHLHW